MERRRVWKGVRCYSPPPGDWKNVLENAFPMIQPHFPTIFLIFQCFSETLSDRQMEAVASLLSTFKIHLILGDMFVSERFVRGKSVHQATTQRTPSDHPATTQTHACPQLLAAAQRLPSVRMSKWFCRQLQCPPMG